MQCIPVPVLTVSLDFIVMKDYVNLQPFVRIAIQLTLNVSFLFLNYRQDLCITQVTSSVTSVLLPLPAF